MHMTSRRTCFAALSLQRLTSRLRHLRRHDLLSHLNENTLFARAVLIATEVLVTFQIVVQAVVPAAHTLRLLLCHFGAVVTDSPRFGADRLSCVTAVSSRLATG